LHFSERLSPLLPEIAKLDSKRGCGIYMVMRLAPKNAPEVDAVTIGQKAAANARKAVSGMSPEAQQVFARRGMARLYQNAGH